MWTIHVWRSPKVLSRGISRSMVLTFSGRQYRCYKINGEYFIIIKK
jgi:hypothetical protein